MGMKTVDRDSISRFFTPAFFLFLLVPLAAAGYLTLSLSVSVISLAIRSLNAAHAGDLDLVRDLLKSGKNPNHRDGFGDSPLTVAADAGQTDRS